ncbi:hypothetical protein BSPLISOX_1356 [uncultured Gammaproteobacteria bacterium]|nr:hypothetical protein BSPLISOX_1356 [uncultured Gammaproteobacteria bacterium]
MLPLMFGPLVEPRAVRVAPATSLSIVVAWLSFLVADCGLLLTKV